MQTILRRHRLWSNLRYRHISADAQRAAVSVLESPPLERESPDTPEIGDKRAIHQSQATRVMCSDANLRAAQTLCSVAKAVPKTYSDLSRTIEVRPAEGVALIE